MAILTVIPETYYTRFRMKGLSLKKVDHQELCIDEAGFFIPNEFKTNGTTAQIKVSELVEFLTDFYDNLPFSGIKIKGRYEITGEELFKLVTTP